MKRKLILFKLSLTFSFILTLTGCFDLGSFGKGHDAYSGDEHNYEEYYKEYYDSIDTIRLYSQSKAESTYDLKDDFFNNETVNNLNKPDFDCSVTENEYIFMAFKVKKELNLEALSMYIKGSSGITEDEILDVYLFVHDNDSFSSIPSYGESVFRTDDEGDFIYDLEGNKLFKNFDIKDKSKAIGKASLRVSSLSWRSFTIDKFGSNEDRSYKVESGKCVVICFYNNTGYQKAINEETTDSSLKRNKVKIKMTNLLMRCD